MSYPFKIVKAMQTSSATVIGAGMQSTKISGSTISIQSSLLPLRNVPVVKVSWNELNVEQQMEMNFRKGKELYGVNEGLPFAIGLADISYLSYSAVKELAQVMASLYTKYFPDSKVLVVVCENDMAKALGQLLRLQTDYDVICIDQVVIDHGDYIDIGAPLHDSMVPVVVKTLAFK
jgi:ethanolamine utilization protein EutA